MNEWNHGCTDWNAYWCPRHDTCNCERAPDGDCQFDGRTCPLHNPGSEHAMPINDIGTDE